MYDPKILDIKPEDLHCRFLEVSKEFKILILVLMLGTGQILSLFPLSSALSSAYVLWSHGLYYKQY